MPNQLNLLIEKEFNARYAPGTDFVVVGYKKLSGLETTELRQTLRNGKVEFHVVKNTIARHVLSANGLGAGTVFLEGPCALATGELETPRLCKLLVDLSKKLEDKLTIRGAVMDGAAITPDGVVVLASIPPLPVLHARFIGSVQAPVVRVAGAFQAILRSLVCALDGIRGKKESSGSPSGPETAASEPAPEAA
jgi:large subunit ribosomal protein L10